ncbi:aquaporin [Streptomyces sp. NPDC048281]|uniref:aquaporin n=1 Tax=Streptomyces sp. NPDC048281 TaxID=3154715 RepID=UPI00343DED42
MTDALDRVGTPTAARPAEPPAWRRTLHRAALELALTTAMLFVVVTATRWLPGTLIAAQIIACGTLSGKVADPVRQFGPAVLAGDTPFPAVYLLAPLLGALATTVVVNRPTRTRRADR